MALLNIVKMGDNTLRKSCRPVGKVTDRTRRLLDDMRETLIDADGVGLAAPQVGVLRRIALVINDEGEILELIDPEIIETEGEQEEIEGCLSVPGKWAVTHRPMRVIVKATDRNGNAFTVSGEGLTARAFCHELDHLDGTLFIDNAVHILTDKEAEEMLR